MIHAEAIAAVGIDIFVADGILAGVIRVAVRKSEVKRRAVVIPCDKEFFFLFGIKTVAIDVIDSLAEFK